MQLGGDVEAVGGEREKVEDESSEGRRDSEGVVQASGKGDLKEQEMTGSTDLEREEPKRRSSKKKKDQNPDADSNESDRSNKSGDEPSRREKVSLLKVLQIGRLKKGLSKDKETWSSLESLNERGVQSETKRETTQSEEEFPKGQKKNQEEEKLQAEAEAANKKVSGKKFPFVSIFSKDKGNDEESDSRGEGDTKLEENPVVTPQSNWRSRKIRKARRLTRGRKIRERSGNNTETSEEDVDKQDGVEGTQEKPKNT